MNIERLTEEATSTSIYHKVADIPNGATVRTAGLTAKFLPEATLLAVGTNGLYNPIASAKVVEAAGAAAVTYSVEKGHLFKVGGKIAKTSSTSVNITAIDATDANKDVITVDATLGVRAIGSGVAGDGVPVAITGERAKIKPGNNLFSSAWVIAVVNKNMVPEPVVKPAGILYV